MSKNLRKDERKDIKISVELTFQDELYAVVNTRNISRGGMFLEVSDVDKFPIGDMVNVHYLDPLNIDTDSFRDAIIVHKNSDGLGLCFIEVSGF